MSKHHLQTKNNIFTIKFQQGLLPAQMVVFIVAKVRGGKQMTEKNDKIST